MQEQTTKIKRTELKQPDKNGQAEQEQSARNLHADVAIVGYGPTGATLANLLAQCGVSVVVIEREAAMYHLPRAVHFDGETMRVFQAVGIANALVKKTCVNPGMRFVDQDHKLLLDWPRPQELGPQGWHASYRLHQPDLEQLLREKLTEYALITELTGTTVVSVEEFGSEVVLNCVGTEDDHTRCVHAQYVVGCDGARSLVRDVIGSGMEDLGFEERWLVIDVLLKRDRPDLGDHSIQFCNPERPMTYCRSPANRRRWEITLLEGEADDEVCNPARIWDFLKPWIGPDDADLERNAVYRFRSAVATQWRSGRLMIAGDAAHLTPPFMGQGMCTGIRDAANLAWKLALCIKEKTSTALLESYQAERSPNAREYIETAMRLGGLINSLDRDTALAQAEKSGSGSARMSSIAPPLGASSLAGLIGADSPHQGYLSSQVTLNDGRWMDDVVGYAPELILRNKLTGGSAPCMVTLDADTHPGLLTILDEHSANAILIRPDRYIAASAVNDEDILNLASINLLSPLA